MRKKKGLVGIAVALSVGLVLSGCSQGGSPESSGDGSPVPGGVLQYATYAQPGSGGFDPMVVANFAGLSFMEQVYDTLLARDAEGKYIPALAESYEQLDELTYNFTLRDNATFSNGDVLTPADVIFTFESYLEATTSKKQFLLNLASVTDIGNNTVQFTFTSPNGMFLNAVSSKSTFFIVQKEWYESTTVEERERKPMGTGPFVLDKWIDNVSLSFVRNEHYWEKDKPYLDGINFQIVPDESSRLALVQQGSVEAAWFTDSAVASQAADAGYKLGDVGYTKKVSVYLNPETGPLNDIRVRQALSLSLGRDQIVDLAAGGVGAASLTVVVGDPASTKPDKKTPYYTRDVDAAKKLLADAGQPNPVIDFTYPSDFSPEDIPVYEVMKQQAADAGITINLVATPWAEIQKIFTFGESFTDMVAIWNIANADYTGYFNQFITDEGPMAHWQGNPEADEARALLAQLGVETDPAARKKIADELNINVAENVLKLIPLAKPQVLEVWDESKLKGYETDAFSFRIALKDAWLAQ